MDAVCTHVYVEAEVLDGNLNASCDGVCSGKECLGIHRELVSRINLYLPQYVCTYIRTYIPYTFMMSQHSPTFPTRLRRILTVHCFCARRTLHEGTDGGRSKVRGTIE